MLKKAGIECGAFVVLILAACGGAATPAPSPRVPVASAKPQAAAPSPSPTPSPSPAFSDAERAYAAAIHQESDSLGQSFTDFSTLITARQADDFTWELKVMQDLNTWHDTYHAAQALPVPPRFAGVQRSWLAGLADFDQAATQITQGMDNQDYAETAAANQTLLDGNTQMGQAKAQLAEMLH